MVKPISDGIQRFYGGYNTINQHQHGGENNPGLYFWERYTRLSEMFQQIGLIAAFDCLNILIAVFQIVKYGIETVKFQSLGFIMYEKMQMIQRSYLICHSD